MTEDERYTEIGRLVEEYEVNKKQVGCYRSKIARIQTVAANLAESLRRPASLSPVRKGGYVVGFNSSKNFGLPLDTEELGALLDGLAAAEAEKSALESALKGVGLTDLIAKP